MKEENYIGVIRKGEEVVSEKPKRERSSTMRVENRNHEFAASFISSNS